MPADYISMKSKTLNSSLLMLGLLVGLLVGCTSQEIPETAPVPKAAPPSLELRSSEIEVFSFETAELRARFLLHNPGGGPLRLEHYHYTLNSGPQGAPQSARREPGLSIAPGSDKIIELTLQLPLGTPLPADAEDPQPELQFTLTLETQVSEDNGKDRLLRASAAGSIAPPVLPHVSVPEVIIRQFETRIIRLEYVVEVQNPNTFAVRYSPQPHEFSFAGKSWVREALPAELRLEAGGSKSIAMPLQINYMKAGRRTVDILIGDKSMEYGLNGQAEARPAEARPIAAEHAAAAEPQAYRFTFERSGTAKIIRP